MTLLKNTLNITSLIVHDSSHPKTIENCFLFLSSETFREKSYQEQVKRISRLRNKLSNDINDILEISSEDMNNPKFSYKKILKSYPEYYNLSKSLIDFDYILGKEFIFILEELVQNYRIVIVERETFVLYKSEDFKEKDKILIIKKIGDEYFPVFTKPEQYIFNIHDDVIQLIKMFHIQRINTNLPVLNIDNTDITEHSVEELVYILDDDDIMFDDTEDIFIKYNNNTNSILYTKEEEIVQIQNLLSSSPYSTEKATGQNLYSLLHDYLNIYKKITSLNMYPVKVATSDRHLDDWENYIEEFSLFKKSFPEKPFVSSPFFQTIENKNNTFSDENIIRNSFNNTFVRTNDFDKVFDPNDCTTITKNTIDNILTTFDIKITSKIPHKKLCEKLSAYNFLYDEIIEIISQISTKEIRELSIEYNILNFPKAGSRVSLINFLIKNNIHIFKNKFTLQQLNKIQVKHKLNNIFDDNPDKLYDNLTSFNLLEFALKTNISTDKNLNNNILSTRYAFIDNKDNIDNVTKIMASSNLPEKIKKSLQNLQLFRPSSYDSNISINGFYYQGNPNSDAYEIFDIANYINILNNLQSFLPLKCTIVYHSDNPNIYEGEIIPMENNTGLLKIKTKNTYVYYNLKNLFENTFFVYPDFYDGYIYQKRDLYKNIYFIINNYSFKDMLRFVSLSIQEYLNLFEVVIDSFDSLVLIMNRFDIDIFNINTQDYNNLIKHVSKPSIESIEKDVNTEISTRNSAFKFLEFNNTNISDTHKMFLLHKLNYFKIIHDIVSPLYDNHSSSTLDSNTNNILSSSNKVFQNIVIPQNIYNFDDLKKIKLNSKDIIESNTNLELLSRKNKIESYLENNKTINQKYLYYINKISLFYFAKHEKQYIKELKYVKKEKIKDGVENLNDTQWIFINSDPNLFHAPIVVDEVKQDLLKTNLDTLIHISGVSITKKEKDFILYQSEIINVMFLHRQKQQNNASISKPNDFELYKHFIRYISYASFITIFAQFRYNIDTVFKSCSKSFSLHGFPLDKETDKTFTKYMSCIIYLLIKEKNKFVQSEAFINSFIQAGIKLIFQQNPVIKTMFDKSNKSKNNTKPKVKFNSDNFKPFFISNNIKESVLSNNSKNISNYKNNIKDIKLKSETLPTEFLMQHLCFTKKKKIQYKIINAFDGYTPITKTINIVNTNLNLKDLDIKLSNLIFKFDEVFYKPHPINESKFTKIFIESTKEYIDAPRYYHMIKVNKVYSRILKLYPNMDIYYDIFKKHISINNFNSITEILISLFETLENILIDISNTENIFTFLDISDNQILKTDFYTIIVEFRNYITSIEENYDFQHTTMDDLKRRAEVLREEDKQNKMNKYNNINDDQVYIIKELEQLGINFIQEQDDIVDERELDELDIRNSDNDDNDNN